LSDLSARRSDTPTRFRANSSVTLPFIRRAGLLPWERLSQNLRSSRETELAADYPLLVVTEWIGNSAPVAARNYLSVTDDDFARAARGGAESGARVVQNPVQTLPGSSRQDSKKKGGKGSTG